MIEDFKKWLLNNSKRPATIKTYCSELMYFQNWWKASIGSGEDIVNASSIDINDYKQYLLISRNSRGKKLAPTTVNKKLESIRTFYCFLEDIGKISINPMNKVKPQKDQSRYQAPRWLDRNEKNKIIRVVDNIITWQNNSQRFYRNRALIYLFLLTGLRVGEAVNLELQDINFEKKVIYIQDGKGGKYRKVEFGSNLEKILKDWVTVRELLNSEKTNRIFISQKGGELTIQGVEHVFKKLRKDTNIEDLTPHTLRHTFAKSLIDRGFSIILVADLLGHSDINTTRLYTKSGEGDRRRAVESLDV